MVKKAKVLSFIILLITSVFKTSDSQAMQTLKSEVAIIMRHSHTKSPINMLTRSKSSESNPYILHTGKAAEKTLELQHRILVKDSIEHLRKAGLKLNQVVWDVGCGSGAMTEHIARQVGKKGHVYALDISQDQINVTKQRLETICLTNVTFINADIGDVDLSLGKADIIYSRLLLMHVKDPQSVIEKMYSFLKPGGHLALQESIMSTAHTCPESSAMKKHVKILTSLGKHKGVDFDVGIKLTDLCVASGFKQIESYFLQPRLTVQEAEPMILGRSAEWEKEAIKLGITTEEEMEELKKDFKDMFLKAGPSFYVSLSKQSYVVAKK